MYHHALHALEYSSVYILKNVNLNLIPWKLMWHHAFHAFIHNNIDKAYRPISCLKPMIIKVGKFIGFMQNSNKYSYINNKVINIKSELLFREAEDDFYYFNKINNAYKKLTQAVRLTPTHLKSIILLANICFIKGKIKKALSLYSIAKNISPNNNKITAAIANCNYVLGNYSQALIYIEKSIKKVSFENCEFYSQLLEIKINILFEQKKYKEAYSTFINFKNNLRKISFITDYNINYELLSKKIDLQKKVQKSNLKIV